MVEEEGKKTGENVGRICKRAVSCKERKCNAGIGLRDNRSREVNNSTQSWQQRSIRKSQIGWPTAKELTGYQHENGSIPTLRAEVCDYPLGNKRSIGSIGYSKTGSRVVDLGS